MNHNVAKTILNGRPMWRAYYNSVIVGTFELYSDAVNHLNSLIYGTESSI